MHNEGKRVTVLFRGRGAFTFAIKPAKPYKTPAKWDGMIRGKHINLEMSFEINAHPSEGKPAGFAIKGTGFDDGNKFTVKSDLVPFDPHEFFGDWSDSYFEKDGAA